MIQGKGLNFSPSQEGTHIRIDIPFQDGDREEAVAFVLDTASLDTMIRNLADARSRMTPPHPRQLDPNPIFRTTARKALFIMGFMKNLAGEMYLATLHPGYGWICYPMTPEAALNVANNLTRLATELLAKRLIGPNGQPLRPAEKP